MAKAIKMRLNTFIFDPKDTPEHQQPLIQVSTRMECSNCAGCLYGSLFSTENYTCVGCLYGG